MAEVDQLMPSLNTTEINGLYFQTLGEIAITSNHGEEAIENFAQALAIYQKDKLQLGVLEAETSLVKAYIANKDFEKAEVYANRGLDRAYQQSNITYMNSI